jgi:hypothetical protein
MHNTFATMSFDSFKGADLSNESKLEFRYCARRLKQIHTESAVAND